MEEGEEELEEKLQTVAYSEVGARTVTVKGQDGKVVELDPDASLITDFTVITDLRVGVLISRLWILCLANSCFRLLLHAMGMTCILAYV